MITTGDVDKQASTSGQTVVAFTVKYLTRSSCIEAACLHSSCGLPVFLSGCVQQCHNQCPCPTCLCDHNACHCVTSSTNAHRLQCQSPRRLCLGRLSWLWILYVGVHCQCWSYCGEHKTILQDQDFRIQNHDLQGLACVVLNNNWVT